MKQLYKLAVMLLITVTFTSVTELSAQAVLSEQQKNVLMQISIESSQIWQQKRAEAEIKASEYNIPVRKELPNGAVIELQEFQNGMPIYYITHNRQAAEASSTNELYPGGALGLNLTGMGRTLGMWDGGLIRESHQEFGGRAVQQDDADEFSDHATHVGGTMIAAGVLSSARGMAYEADLDAYDWSSDTSEMADAAVQGLIVSNHSYGSRMGWECDESASVCNDDTNDELWKWFGNPDISETEDFKFGFYNSKAAQWDSLVYHAPNYVIVKSAGNDRNDSPASQPVEHEVWESGVGWVTSTTVRDPDGGSDGYMSLGHIATAKNVITVGAVRNNTNMSSFSSWGPTNDGRIKPDIVATGVSVTSAGSDADDDYSSKSGTSMASPVVSGSISLLQQHYNMLHGDFPTAATVRALIIHTADNLDAEGPTYRNGWGMLNTKRAAEVISMQDEKTTDHILELTLNNSATYEQTIWSNGEEPLRATISWTDPAGTPVDPAIDATDRMLVNDLDLRLIDEDGNEFEPYFLNPDSPGEIAWTGDNDRDNVEQVYIEAPELGYYTIRVTHKDNLENGSQDFALIVTGNDDPLDAAPGFLTLSDTDEQGYAYASDNSFNSVSGDHMTIEFWVNMDAESDENAVIISKQGSDDASNGYSVRTVGGGEERPLKFSPTSFTGRHLVTNSGIRAGEWTHISAIYDDGNTYIYINGQLDAENTSGSRVIGSTNNDLTIGSNTTRTGQFFRGSIGDLRIWGLSRSMFDIQADFDQRLEGNETGLRVYYPFGVESSNIASDATGFGSDLTFVNIIGTEKPGVFPVTPIVYGKIADQSAELKISERDFAEDVASEFRIYRTEASSGDRTEVATISGSDQFFTDNGLNNGQTYYYEVTVIDEDGHEGDFSNPLPLTPNQQIGGTTLSFDGLGFVDFSNRPNLNISGDHITVEVWVKRDANSSGNQAILTNKTTTDSNGYALHMIDGGEEARVRFYPTDFSARYLTSNTGLRANEWTHVAAVYNDGITQIYINGQLDAENTTSSRRIGSTGNNLTLGSNVENNGQFFQGEIDELRIWNHSRSMSEIQSDFNSILWGDEEGLVGYWRFDSESGKVYGQAMRPATSEGAGALSHDGNGVFPVPPQIHAKPNGENIFVEVAQPSYAADDVGSFVIYRSADGEGRSEVATLSDGDFTFTDSNVDNGVLYSYDATIVDNHGGESDEAYPVVSAVYDGHPGGNALRFIQNQSTHVEFEFHPALNISGDHVTVETWIMKDEASQQGAVILENNSASSNGYSLYLTDDGTSSRVTFAPTDFSRTVTTQTSLQPNKWYHIAAVYEDGDTYIYVDGALDNVNESSSRRIGSNSNGLVIGANYLGTGDYFVGELDEIRIWNHSVEKDSIQSRYNSSLTGNEEGLVGYWRFDEPSGNVAHGSAKRPMHGTLVNSPQFVASAIFEGDPFVPVLATPVNDAEDQEVPLTFEWYPVDNAIHYEIEISKSESFNTVILEREIADTTTTIDMGLEYDTDYFWRVRANTNQFLTNWSDVWVFTTEFPVPDTPEWKPEDGAEGVETSIALQWTEAARAETYRVQMSLVPDFSETELDSAGIEETELFVEDLEVATTYYWRVLASNSTGDSDWSDTLEFTTVFTSLTESLAGIPDDFALNQNYPNPFNPVTTIEFGLPTNAEVQLEVYNIVGRRVAVLVSNEQKQAGWHQATFDASSLSSGVYIYRIRAGDFVETRKLTLIK